MAGGPTSLKPSSLTKGSRALVMDWVELGLMIKMERLWVMMGRWALSEAQSGLRQGILTTAAQLGWL